MIGGNLAEQPAEEPPARLLHGRRIPRLASFNNLDRVFRSAVRDIQLASLRVAECHPIRHSVTSRKVSSRDASLPVTWHQR